MSCLHWSLHLLESSKISLFEGHSLRPVPTLWPSLASKIHRLAILPAQSPHTRVLDLSHQDSPNSLANVLRISKGFILYVHGEYTGATERVYIWRSEDSSQVSILFSTRWVPGMELGTSGLLARTITSWSLLPIVFRTFMSWFILRCFFSKVFFFFFLRVVLGTGPRGLPMLDKVLLLSSSYTVQGVCSGSATRNPGVISESPPLFHISGCKTSIPPKPSFFPCFPSSSCATSSRSDVP